MSKIAFSFHIVTSDWGKQLPDGDFTIGRSADPRGRGDNDQSNLAASDDHAETRAYKKQPTDAPGAE